ncbi:hypothetical protein KEM55_006263 [Ascosphaera atra]|nr:hypothetical protein KEM55_006263 [Ascosphaera atra]
MSPENEAKKAREPWRRRGFVFGAPWEQFKAAFERYRKWVHSCFENEDEVRARLVFAHNDTQYGNILKMEPTNQSPLLMPANEHRQLVVIDFEYASANMRGLEFANHFTEWCYDYHDEHESWKCKIGNYPKPEEQERFIKAYLTHRPYQADQTPSAPSTRATPMTLPIHPSRSPRIPPLVLDDHNEVDLSKLADTDSVDADVLKLMGETRMWRPANSAQWSAWGIVQAKVPGLEEALDGPKKNENPEDSREGDKESTTGDQSEEQEEGEEFDYLAYAQDRACFFWADLLALGIVQENELEGDMLKHIKERIIEF